MYESFAAGLGRPPVIRALRTARKGDWTVKDPIRFSRRTALGMVAAASAGAILGGCSDDEGGSSGAGKKISWWHIANTDPMLSEWAKMARQFEASHPGVKFEITPLE